MQGSAKRGLPLPFNKDLVIYRPFQHARLPRHSSRLFRRWLLVWTLATIGYLVTLVTVFQDKILSWMPLLKRSIYDLSKSAGLEQPILVLFYDLKVSWPFIPVALILLVGWLIASLPERALRKQLDRFPLDLPRRCWQRSH
jgi:hypothetical protein